MDARGQKEPRAPGVEALGPSAHRGLQSTLPARELVGFRKARQPDNEKGRPKAAFQIAVRDQAIEIADRARVLRNPT